MKYFIITYGCQMNEHDSERIRYLLEEMGYTKAESKEDADFVLFNTCLVRENAELKVYGQIGAMKQWKKEKPDRVLAISGCMMQTGEARNVIQEKYPQVDIIFGTGNIGKLPELVQTHKQTGKRVIDVERFDDPDSSFFHRDNHFSAYVNIMTGCDNFCSYCVVPYARGREESRRVGDILEEVQSLAKRGFREVILLGQNVNSFGDGTFPALLRRVHEIAGIERIRFMSSHPKDLSDELIDVIAQCPKIERHFHLPLQSGSNKVLKEMNRKYTREKYMEIVEKLRKKVPGISITTDLIVGFPGETEEDHKDTLDLCRRVEFDSAFTFLYSPREGTPAAKRSDQVDEKTASRRFQELLDVLYPIFLRKNQEEIGTTVHVLAEGVSKNNDLMLTGRDAKNKLVHFPGGKEDIGKLIRLRVTSCNSFALEGKRIK